jgi:hypothetical protein
MLNQALDSPYLGFAILAAFFLVLLIGVLIVKQTNWYHNKITTITDQIVEDSNNKQDERENSPEITGINP